ARLSPRVPPGPGEEALRLFGFLRRWGAEETPPCEGGAVPQEGVNSMFESLRQNGAADKSPTHIFDHDGVGRTPSEKQLRWLLDTTEHRLLTITPALADVMLRYNDANRPLSAATVRKYARQMGEGRWRLTKQPIIFSKSHKLLDGQHRLHACVESGVTIQAWV